MKNKIILLTTLCSMLLNSCGSMQNENSASKAQIQIATIQQSANETELTTAQEVLSSGFSETIESTEVSEPDNFEENMNITETSATDVTLASEKTTTETEPVSSYTDLDFEKAIYAAIVQAFGTEHEIGMYLVNDADGDTKAECMFIMPYSDNSSQNVMIEHPSSAGVYYYNANGQGHDYFVIDPENGRALLNENTVRRTEATTNENGTEKTTVTETIISREYFIWQSDHWESQSLLYNGKCYWKNQTMDSAQFMTNVANLQNVVLEDIFNLSVKGGLHEVANGFYEFLSAYFDTTQPMTVDMDADGSSEIVIAIQNLPKTWVSNIHSLYNGDNDPFDRALFENMHTTCFIMDIVTSGYVRIRSANFDRKYTFAESGGKLFAYDDTNSVQTIEYSSENAVLGESFMTVMWGR